ncbi:hypothetical protein MBLNU230_g0087t1 [Neophaeotheca triangularis]
MHLVKWLVALAGLADATYGGAGYGKTVNTVNATNTGIAEELNTNTAVSVAKPALTGAEIPTNVNMFSENPKKLGADNQDLAVDGEQDDGAFRPPQLDKKPSPVQVKREVLAPRPSPVAIETSKVASTAGGKQSPKSVGVSPDDQNETSGTNAARPLAPASKAGGSCFKGPKHVTVSPDDQDDMMSGESNSPYEGDFYDGSKADKIYLQSDTESQKPKLPVRQYYAGQIGRPRVPSTDKFKVFSGTEPTTYTATPATRSFGRLRKDARGAMSISPDDLACLQQDMMTVTHTTTSCYQRMGVKRVATGISCTATGTSVETGRCLQATTTTILSRATVTRGKMPAAVPTPAVLPPRDGSPLLCSGICSWDWEDNVASAKALFDNAFPMCKRHDVKSLHRHLSEVDQLGC